MAHTQQDAGLAPQVAHLADVQQQTVIIQERILGRLDAHDKQFEEIYRVREREEGWQHQRSAQTPDAVRGWVVVALMITGMVLTALCSGASLLISVWSRLH